MNAYLVKSIKDLTPLDKLCASINTRNKKVKTNPKQQLTLLRELCIQVTSKVSLEDNFSAALVDLIKDLSDQDGDRKLLRTYVFILLELFSYSKPNSDVIAELITFMIKEINTRTNTRQFLAYRTLGVLFSYNLNLNINESTNDNVHKVLSTALKDLKYVGKQKKSMFANDKDHVVRIQQWSSIMSSLSYTKRVIPKECYANLFYGVLSTHPPLVRSSLLVLLNSVTVLTDEQSILELCSMFLDRYRKGREYLNLDDPLAGTYFLRIIAAVTRNVNWEHADCKARLLDLYVVALDFLKDPSPKVVCEAVALFTDHGASSWHVLSLLQARNTPRVFPQIIDGLLVHIKQLAADSMSMPLLHRTCVKLGRFLISRPYTSASEEKFTSSKSVLSSALVEKDGEALIPLWVNLKKFHYKKLLSPSDPPANIVALMNSGHIAPAGKDQPPVNRVNLLRPGAESTVSADQSYFAGQPNFGVANPHALCECIKSFIWLAPDKRYCKKEHTPLWTIFTTNLLETVDALATQPDVSDTLLESLLANYFARVRSSMLVSTAAVSLPQEEEQNVSSKSQTIDLLGDLDEADNPRLNLGNSGQPKYTLRYEAGYVETLLLVAEKILAVCPNAKAVSHMQNVWSFVSMCARSKSVSEKTPVPTPMATDAASRKFNINSPNNDAFDSLLLLNVEETFIPGNSSISALPEVKADEFHVIHAKHALLKSILSVLELTRSRDVSSGAEDQALTAANDFALWYLAEHASLWKNVVDVSQYLSTKPASVTKAPPLKPHVMSFTGGLLDTAGADGSECTEESDVEDCVLHLIVAVLGDAASTSVGNTQRIALEGLMKVGNALYLPAVVDRTYTSGISDISTDKHINATLTVALLRIAMTLFTGALDLRFHSSAWDILDNHDSDGELCALLSLLKLSPREEASTTVGDFWRSGSGATPKNSGSLLSLIAAKCDSALYGSILATLLVLFEYSTRSGELAVTGREAVLLVPSARRVATFQVPIFVPEAMETPLLVDEPVAEEDEEEESVASASASRDDQDDFGFSTTAVADNNASTTISHNNFNISNGKANANSKVSLKIATTPSTSPSKISKAKSGIGALFGRKNSTASVVTPTSGESSSAAAAQSDSFGWSASTPHSADSFGDSFGGDSFSQVSATGAVSDWGNSDFTTTPAGPTGSDAFGWSGASVVATADDFGFAPSVATAADSDFSDPFAPSAATPLSTSAGDDLFSFSASDSAGPLTTSSFATSASSSPFSTGNADFSNKFSDSGSDWNTVAGSSTAANTAANRSSAGKSGVPLVIPGPKKSGAVTPKKTPLKQSAPAPTASSSTFGDFDTTMSASAFPTTDFSASSGGFESNNFVPSGGNAGFGDSAFTATASDAFGASSSAFVTTSTTTTAGNSATDDFAATSVAPAAESNFASGYGNGYGSGYGDEAATSAEWSAPHAPAEQPAHMDPALKEEMEFSSAVANAARALTTTIVAPTQPANKLISDLFGSDDLGSVADAPLPGLPGLSTTAGISSFPSISPAAKKEIKPKPDLNLDNLFPTVTPVTNASTPSTLGNRTPIPQHSEAPSGGDLFGESDWSTPATTATASGSSSAGAKKSVPILSKPVVPTLAASKLKGSASKKDVKAVADNSLDIFSSGTPAQAGPVRSNSISSTASFESATSAHTVNTVNSSVAFSSQQQPVLAARKHSVSSIDSDAFGVSVAQNTFTSSSVGTSAFDTAHDSPFGDDAAVFGGGNTSTASNANWASTSTASMTGSSVNSSNKPVPVVPTLAKPVVPVLSKPVVKVNPFATSATGKAKPVAGAAAKRGSVVHSDLMNLDMPVLTPTNSSASAAPTGWPTAPKDGRSSFGGGSTVPVDPFAPTSTSKPADPFAPNTSSHIDPFAASTTGSTPAAVHSNASDGFAPSTGFAASASTDFAASPQSAQTFAPSDPNALTSSTAPYGAYPAGGYPPQQQFSGYGGAPQYPPQQFDPSQQYNPQFAQAQYQQQQYYGAPQPPQQSQYAPYGAPPGAYPYPPVQQGQPYAYPPAGQQQYPPQQGYGYPPQPGQGGR